MTEKRFNITVEVVPPAGPDVEPLLARLKPLVGLTFDAFSVATNPVAKPRMSAMALFIMGILPLRSARHAEFLHAKVAGIAVPQHVREQIRNAGDPAAAGVAHAAEMLALARTLFSGACLMPPFDHYEVLFELLEHKR